MVVKLADGGVLSSPQKTFAERLRSLRRTVGKTQPDFADLLGVSSRTYKNYEAGHRELPLEGAKRLIVEFGLDAEWFLFGEEGRPEVSKKGGIDER